MRLPATSARMTWIASSRFAIVVGGLPRTRRAESPRPMPRSIRPPDSSSSVASADAVTLGSRVPGFVTHVPRRRTSVASAISVRRGYGSRQRTWESNSQPWLNPAASAWRASATVRAIVFSGFRVNPKSISSPMLQDVHDDAVRVADEEAPDAPWLVREGMHDLRAGCRRAVVDGVDVGHLDGDGR